jgi:hypothetical protein
MIDCEYENAVYEQKKVLREYKKKGKSSGGPTPTGRACVPMTFEEDISSPKL